MSLPLTIVLILLTTIYTLLRLFTPPKSFPPGPRFLALTALPKEQEWCTYAKWKKIYGPIVGMRMMGTNIVILNTPELIRELFGNRGTIYGERPIVPMLDMMGLQDWNIGVMQRGELHTLTRKLMSTSLSMKALSPYKEIQQEEVYHLLVHLLDSPGEFKSHFRTVMVTIVMRIFYGLKVSPDDDFVKLNDDLISVASIAGAPAGYLVNVFPLLKYLPSWFPGTGFRKTANEGRKLANRMFSFPVDVLKHKIDTNEAEPSFLSPYLQNAEYDPMGMYAAQAVAGTAYSAGVETSTSVMITLILAMLRYPDVQRKAQEELDSVIPGKLPTFDDMEKLPYVSAVVSECYRWATPAPLGLPRLLTQDDIVMQYTIPKGTIVLPNSWAILRDESIYPNPTQFVPERFIGKNPQPDPREHVFGYGRRVCSGRYLADQIVWLSIACVLAGFTISPEEDEMGNAVIPPYEYTSGIMSRPKDFNCRIFPKSNAMVQAIKSVYVN